MKKQYRLFETLSFRYNIELYHDGEFVEAYKVWQDELSDEIDKLKEQGYTYGYTKDEVSEAKLRYERMLESII